MTPNLEAEAPHNNFDVRTISTLKGWNDKL